MSSELYQLRDEWQLKLASAKTDKDREIANKRLDKLNQQIVEMETKELGNITADELAQKLDSLYHEKEKIDKLIAQFKDPNLIPLQNELAEKINSIEQFIKPDELVNYESDFGPIVWNKTKKTVTIGKEVTLTEDEVGLIEGKITDLDFEVMKRFKAKPIQSQIEWNN